MASINNIRLASTLDFDSIVDGPGLRIVVWTQGCPHGCKGCHNPQTHDMCGGFEMPVEEVIMQMKQAHLQQGITFSGGEPFMQPEALVDIAKAAHEMGLNVWAFSGFTFEEIMADTKKKALLEEIDVLVDGRFVEALKSYKLHFKGSSNQRIIDVQKSLQENVVVISAYDEANREVDI